MNSLDLSIAKASMISSAHFGISMRGLSWAFTTRPGLGSAVGIASSRVCRRPEVDRHIVAPVMALYDRRPGLVLAAVFLVTSQTAAMFEPLLDVVKVVRDLVRWLHVH
jgi:hypothetical protein